MDVSVRKGRAGIVVIRYGVISTISKTVAHALKAYVDISLGN